MMTFLLLRMERILQTSVKRADWRWKKGKLESVKVKQRKSRLGYGVTLEPIRG